MLTLAWRLFRRDLRSGEHAIPFTALVLAVTIVAMLGLSAERLQHALDQRGATFMAGDLVLRSTRALDAAWFAMARERGLRVATVLDFATMAAHGDAMQLVSVKAVDDSYPLLGAIDIATTDGGAPLETGQGPVRGEVWADARTLNLLGIAIGERVVIGEQELRIGAMLVREPDAAASLFALGPRLMMHLDDVGPSGIVQPGSRVQYSYLLAGAPAALAAWRAEIEPRLLPGQHFLTPSEGMSRVANALGDAESFLLLGGSAGVVLAGVAMMMAVNRYTARHAAQVAVLKTLGMTGRAIRTLHVMNLLWLLLPGILLGWLLAWGLQELVFALFSDVVAGELPSPGPHGLWLGAGTGALALLGLAVPPLLGMSETSPVGVLRQEPPPRALPAVLHGCALLTLALLLRWYGGDWALTGAVLGVLGGVAIVVGGTACLLLGRARVPAVRTGSMLGLAAAGLRRHAPLNALQMLVLTFALLLGLVIVLLRTALVDDWEQGIDPLAPNRFLLNIAPHQVAAVEEFLERHGVVTAGLYPMVPGRIAAVDGGAPLLREGETIDLDRDFNLTWADSLPADNRIVAGSWWEAQARGEVSVEAGIARALGLHVGSVLTVQVGPRRFDAVVSSIRELDWDSMRPNFFVIFPRHLLESEAAMWLTSFHVDDAHTDVLAALLRAYPTLTLIDVDALLGQLRSITRQLARAISLVAGLLVLAALLVVVASVRAGLDIRLQEGAVLRVFGASRQLVLGSLIAEFAAIGALAGLLAAAGAEAAAWLVQTRLMHLHFHAHPLLWLAGPALGALGSAVLGFVNCRSVVHTPPLVALRACS